MYCGPSTDVNSAFVVSDLITDVMVLCLPLPVVSTHESIAFFTAEIIAKVIDLAPSNDNSKKTDGNWYFGDWSCVSGYLNDCKLIPLTDLRTSSIVASIMKVIISFQITTASLFEEFDQDRLSLSFKYEKENLLTNPHKVTNSTILYWSMIEAGLAVIAACLPTLGVLVGKFSLSSILYSVRSALSIGSIYPQRQQGGQKSSPHSKESYAYIHAGLSASSTSDAVRDKNTIPINNLIIGKLNWISEPHGDGIQVSRQFSQHVSMV